MRGTARPPVDPLHYTYDDLASIPDDGRRYEILDGELVVSPAPFLRHQMAVKRLFLTLHRHVARHDLGEVFFAPLDVVFEPINVLEPDVLFIAKDRLPPLDVDEPVRLVPDLVVEVLSKGTAKRDRVTKRELYERFRVRHYWIVDPFTRSLEENILRGARYARRSQLTPSARGRDPIFRPAAFAGLVIDLRRVFG